MAIFIQCFNGGGIVGGDEKQFFLEVTARLKYKLFFFGNAPSNKIAALSSSSRGRSKSLGPLSK